MATLIVLLLSCVACAHGPMAPDEPLPAGSTPRDTAGDEVIELRVGTTAPVPGTTSTISFVRVADDSRCPKGVKCIWEGDAVVELRVQPQQAEASRVEVHTNQRFQRQARIDGVTVTLETLAPYPEADAPVPADRYVATLRIAAP